MLRYLCPVNSILRLILLSMGIGLLSACVNVSSERGVEKRWGKEELANTSVQWTEGKTTKSQVLKDLGPPSQVVAVGDETVFYYLREKVSGRGVVLLVYNDVRVQAGYDRAIFFFDQQGRLKDFAVSEIE